MRQRIHHQQSKKHLQFNLHIFPDIDGDGHGLVTRNFHTKN